VAFADWTPDGKSLSVVRDIGGRWGLFYPEDHLVYESSSWISHVRFSPDGKQLAFIDHPRQDDGGDVFVVPVGAGAKPRKLAGGFVSVQGLAWQPGGKEVWATGTRSGVARALEAIDLSGKERVVCRVPATFTLYDLLANGRALIAEEDYRSSIFGTSPGESQERDLSALDWSGPRGCSDDGKLVSFDESGEGGGENGAVYVRKTDGSPPVMLGVGNGGGVSSDGAWVAGTSPDAKTILVYPTGAGKAKSYSLPFLVSRAQFVSRDREICFAGVEKGHGPRLYLLNLSSGKARPISEEGIQPVTYMPRSPDGQLILGLDRDRRPVLYSVDGSTPKPIPGVQTGDFPAGWSADGKTLYFYRRGEMPVRVFRVEMGSGNRTLWKQITAPDPAGITGIAPVIVSTKGDSYVYGATRILSTLYLVDGLK
jgi:Tol biopolymer transport system component